MKMDLLIEGRKVSKLSSYQTSDVLLHFNIFLSLSSCAVGLVLSRLHEEFKKHK